MTFLESIFESNPWLRRGLMLVLLIGLGVGSAAGLGFIIASQPLLGIGAVAAVLLALGSLVWPNPLVLTVLLILYTNAAVVAVHFHHVPFVVGAAVPLLLIVPFTYYLIIRREKLIVTPVTLLLALLLVIQLVGTLLSGAQHVAMSANALTTFAVEGFGLFFLITNVVRTPAMLRQAIVALLLAGAFLGFLSFYQQLTRTYANDYGGFAQMSNAAFDTGVEQLQGAVQQRRLAGPIGDQNYYAQFMLMLVPVGLFQFWGARSKLLRVVAAMATLLITIGIALTFSRGAALGFALMLVIMAFMRYIKPYQVVLILLGIILVLQAFPQYGMRLMSLEQLSGVTQQDTGGINNADSAVQSRMTEMLTAGLVALDYPVFGVGPGLFKYYYPQYAGIVGGQVQATARAAHNLYLEMAAETGISGLICFLLIVFVTLRNLARNRKRCLQSSPEFANIATGFTLAIVSYLTAGMFLSLAYERYFWLMLALAAATSQIVDTAGLVETESQRRMNAEARR